jgi:hypothetical protein
MSQRNCPLDSNNELCVSHDLMRSDPMTMQLADGNPKLNGLLRARIGATVYLIAIALASIGWVWLIGWLGLTLLWY